jgi:opacity protein-like surface antigen
LRVDYRNGSNIESIGLNGGLRYNFDPSPNVKPVGIFKAPVATAAVYNWSGFYVGAFAGGGASSINDWYFPLVNEQSHPRIAGGLLGGNAGYNWQFGSWVVGLEADIAASNTRGGQSCIGSNIPGFVNAPVVQLARFVQNCNNDMKWLATATARAGYAWDGILVYGKAGGAWAENSLDIACNGDPEAMLAASIFGPVFPSRCSLQNTRVPIGVIPGGPRLPETTAKHLTATVQQFGFTVGAGFELALTQAWSAKAEYDYINFGSKNVVFPGATPVNLRQDFHEVKIGINYHFGKDGFAMASTMPVR